MKRLARDTAWIDLPHDILCDNPWRVRWWPRKRSPGICRRTWSCRLRCTA